MGSTSKDTGRLDTLENDTRNQEILRELGLLRQEINNTERKQESLDTLIKQDVLARQDADAEPYRTFSRMLSMSTG